MKHHLIWAPFEHLCEAQLTPEQVLTNKGLWEWWLKSPIPHHDWCPECIERLYWIQRIQADPTLARTLGYTGRLPLTWITLQRVVVQTAKDAFYPLLGLAGLVELLRLLTHH